MTTATKTVPVSAAQMNGLEFLNEVRLGRIGPAPISDLMGIEPVRFEPGLAQWRCVSKPSFESLIGTVHGGVIATLLDSAVGCAVHTTLEAGDLYSTLELSVNYVRPMDATSGAVTATGEVIHVGRNIATAEGRLTSDATGKLVAHAKSTLMIKRA